ncbi:MAG TPA: hypothetical protein VKV02_12675 [Acidobacteriaceae bacterium]|nr:hypothetical protein [Acidobacteriaceae bacterium]
MNLSRAALASVLLFPALSASAFADGDTFLLVATNGHTLGKASYSIREAKIGYEVKSYYTYKAMRSDLPSTRTVGPPTDARSPASTEAQMYLTYKVAANGDLIEGYMQNQANGLMTSFNADRQGALQVSSVQDGHHGLVNTVPMPHPDFMLLPVYDPAAVQVLLTAASAHPSPESTYLLAVPNRDGAYPVQVHLQSAPPAAGVFHQTPCALKVYDLQFGTGRLGEPVPTARVYTDGAGHLMEADLSFFGVRYVRVDFALDQK